MLYLKKLSAVTQNELQAVGHRALDLAYLQQNQIPTAASFIVLSTAFEELMRTNNLKYKIDYILSHAQENIPQSLLNAYNGVRKAMLECQLPHGFETELRETFESITTPIAVGDLVAANDRVPVRILVSANRHDDPENNDTVIQNVNGFEELLVGVREAWALAYHPSQLGARMREKFPENRLKIALIVQSMDKPFASCHAYSCLPQDHHKIYVQAYAGYPDMRERVAKDYFAVGKENLRIIATQTGRQQGMLDRNEQKELVSVPVRGRFEILERDLVEIARLTKKAERALQTPVKAFFTLTEGVPELLWVNRLGFDILLKDVAAQEQTGAQSGAQSLFRPIVPARAPEPAAAPATAAPSMPTATVAPAAAPAPEPVQVDMPAPDATSAPAMPSPDDFIVQAEPASPEPAEPAPLADPVPGAAPVDAVEAPVPATSPAIDVHSGVAAKLLNASLRIVRQVIERKYRGTFSETPSVENLAEMVNRLNQANVFSRPVDGALLLQAEEAARSGARISQAEYAKTIEEVAFLLSYV